MRHGSAEQERREYYKRNFAFWGMFLGFIPASVIAVELARIIESPVLSQLLVLMLFSATIAASVWRMNWRCPRCYERFYYKWWYGQAFSTKCVHCGFRPGSRLL